MKQFLIVFVSLLAAATGNAQAPNTITVLGNEIKESPVVAQQSTPAASGPAVSSEELSLDAIQTEMDQATETHQQTTTKVVKSSKNNPNNMYVMGVAGVSNYPEVGNVAGSYAVSGAIGYLMDSFMFEAGVGMGKYNMDSRNFSTFNGRDNFDVDQYNFQAGAKYRLMDGSFVPNVGALVSYTNRKFTLTNAATPSFNQTATLTGESQTMDAGLSAGVDYEFGKDYAIGLDLKYMFNVSNSAGNSQTAAATPTTAGYTGTPIETLQYYTAGLSGRLNF